MRECLREEHSLVEVVRQEAFEDQLGAALIRPGDSVIIRMKWFYSMRFMQRKQAGWNRE